MKQSARDPRAAGRAIDAGLICDPHPADMATVLRHKLDQRERVWLATSAVLALLEAKAEALADAILDEIDRHRMTPRENEAERQRQRWVDFCSNPARQMRRARP